VEGFSISETPGASRNIYIDCPRCGEYVITDFVQTFYHFPDGLDDLLNTDDKKKIQVYVKKNYKGRDGKPVLIDMDAIKAITGKESRRDLY
jgi:hypothetical protein